MLDLEDMVYTIFSIINALKSRSEIDQLRSNIDKNRAKYSQILVKYRRFHTKSSPSLRALFVNKKEGLKAPFGFIQKVAKKRGGT